MASFTYVRIYPAVWWANFTLVWTIECPTAENITFCSQPDTVFRRHLLAVSHSPRKLFPDEFKHLHACMHAQMSWRDLICELACFRFSFVLPRCTYIGTHMQNVCEKRLRTVKKFAVHAAGDLNLHFQQELTATGMFLFHDGVFFWNHTFSSTLTWLSCPKRVFFFSSFQNWSVHSPSVYTELDK